MSPCRASAHYSSIKPFLEKTNKASLKRIIDYLKFLGVLKQRRSVVASLLVQLSFVASSKLGIHDSSINTSKKVKHLLVEGAFLTTLLKKHGQSRDEYLC